MRRRVLAAAAVLLTLAVASCRDVTTPPTSTGLTRVQTSARVVNPADVEALIVALFNDPSHEKSMLSHWRNIVKEVEKQNPSASSLVSHVNNSVKFTLEDLALGKLGDPDGAGPLIPATGALRLLGWIFEYSGYYPTELPPVPAGTDAFFVIVNPDATTDQTFVTSLGDGAAVVPPGSFDVPVLLAMVRQPEDFDVATPFPKLSRVFDISIAPEVDFESVTAVVCPVVGISDEVNDRAIIAHQLNPTTVEYLERVAGPITCPEDVASAWRENEGFLRQRAGQLASLAGAAWKHVGPKPLYAGHAAIGGILTSFSPVVVVDPYVGTTITPSVGTGTFGQTVNVSANLAATSGPAELLGALGGMTMTASVDGGAPVSGTTDASGNALFTFTSLPAGAHTVTFAFAGMTAAGNAPEYGASTADAMFNVTYNTVVWLDPQPNASFAAGSWLTAKFRIFGPDGVTPVTDASATPTLRHDATGTFLPLTSPAFVYDASSNRYTWFTVIPASAPAGAYTLTTTVNDGTTITIPVTVTSP